MKQYSEDSGTNSNKLSYLKLIKLLKDFEILDKYCTKEEVLMTYSRRCRKKQIDFSAFIDILYIISKLPNNGVLSPDRGDRYNSFKTFIEEALISKVAKVMGKTLYKPTFSKIDIFAMDDSFDNEVLRLFEGYDALLKHVMNSFWFICSKGHCSCLCSTRRLTSNTTISHLCHWKISKGLVKTSRLFQWLYLWKKAQRYYSLVC